MNGTYTQRRRTQMAGGGITTLPRQNYGIGSWVKERVRKIIPKEVAKVAQVAAPFVAPFNPIAGGLMAGLGGFQQTGRVGKSLVSGLGTYGLGQAARYIGGAGMQQGWQNPLSAGSYSVPWGAQTGLGAMMSGPAEGTAAFAKIGSDSGKETIFKKAMNLAAAPFKGLGEKGLGEAMLTVGAIGTGVAYAVDKLVGPKDPGETMEEFNTRRKSTMGEYLRYYYKNVNPLASAEEVEQFVTTNTREYSSQGGRIGYKHGSGLGSLDAGAPSITYEGDMKMASGPYEGTAADADEHSYRMFGKPYNALNEIELEEFRLEMERLQNKFMASDPGMGEGPFMLEEFLQAVKEGFKGTYEDFIDQVDKSPADYMAQGGRVGRYTGGMGLPTIPGIPRMAPDGLEYDMSQHGGFQPLGAQEGKDDVKANLAKNEFVFTADAVRGAGDGDIETGAQRMYDTMKRLEGRVA